MASLGRVIVEAIVLHYGRDEFLTRLAHPFWFQSFGAVMGMDWHSSGITTSVIGALKRGLAPVGDELGLYVCGGRGRHSRKTPAELTELSERLGLDAPALVRSSRLVAKVDSAAVQDGYALYLHGFIVAADGKWAVVQQGMNTESKVARRYHWRSEGLRSFVDAPHAAIEGREGGEVVNLTDRRAARARQAQIELLEQGPDRVVDVLGDLSGVSSRAPRALQLGLPNLQLPAHHDVRASDVVLRRVHGALAAAAQAAPRDFADLLLTPGVGARTVWSLAMVAEVVHGAPCRFTDPARFSLAHGGKDGHPYPVPLDVYDETMRVMRQAVDRARLGREDRLEAVRRLDEQARRLEGWVSGPTFSQLLSREQASSGAYGGRTVFGPARRSDRPSASRRRRAAPPRSGSAASSGQLSLKL